MKLLQMLLQEEMEQCLFLCVTVFERSVILICVLLKKLIVNCLSMNSQCNTIVKQMCMNARCLFNYVVHR